MATEYENRYEPMYGSITADIAASKALPAPSEIDIPLPGRDQFQPSQDIALTSPATQPQIPIQPTDNMPNVPMTDFWTNALAARDRGMAAMPQAASPIVAPINDARMKQINPAGLPISTTEQMRRGQLLAGGGSPTERKQLAAQIAAEKAQVLAQQSAEARDKTIQEKQIRDERIAGIRAGLTPEQVEARIQVEKAKGDIKKEIKQIGIAATKEMLADKFAFQANQKEIDRQLNLLKLDTTEEGKNKRQELEITAKSNNLRAQGLEVGTPEYKQKLDDQAKLLGIKDANKRDQLIMQETTKALLAEYKDVITPEDKTAIEAKIFRTINGFRQGSEETAILAKNTQAPVVKMSPVQIQSAIKFADMFTEETAKKRLPPEDYREWRIATSIKKKQQAEEKSEYDKEAERRLGILEEK